MFSSLQKYSVILAAHTWRSLFTGAGDWIGLDSVILAAHLWQEQGTGEGNKQTNKQTNLSQEQGTGEGDGSTNGWRDASLPSSGLDRSSSAGNFGYEERAFLIWWTNGIHLKDLLKNKLFSIKGANTVLPTQNIIFLEYIPNSFRGQKYCGWYLYVWLGGTCNNRHNNPAPKEGGGGGAGSGAVQ